MKSSDKLIPTRTGSRGEQLYTVRCANCDQNNRSDCKASSIQDADYYLCPKCSSANRQPTPDGYVTILDIGAAPGGWVGITVRPASDEERQSILRAKDILARGLAQIKR